MPWAAGSASTRCVGARAVGLLVVCVGGDADVFAQAELINAWARPWAAGSGVLRCASGVRGCTVVHCS